MIYTKTDLAYLAGFIDGEGTISIAGRKEWHRGKMYMGWRPIMCAYNTKREVLDWIVNTFGGKVYVTPSRYIHSAALYRWVAQQNLTYALAHELRPFLKLKMAQADIVLELAATRLDAKDGKKNGLSRPMETKRAELLERIRALNRRGHALPIKEAA